MDKNNAKEKYLEYQMINQQLNEMNKQLQLIDERLVELQLIDSYLEDLKKTKMGSEVLVPISPGIYAKAELKNNTELVVNVGSGVAVKKSVDDSKVLLSQQKVEIEKIRHDLVHQMQEIDAKAREIEEDIIRAQQG